MEYTNRMWAAFVCQFIVTINYNTCVCVPCACMHALFYSMCRCIVVIYPPKIMFD